jgi:hypothetical protein
VSIDRYAAHRAALASPEATHEELRSTRGFCHFFGGIAIIEAVVSRSWVSVTLLAPAAILEVGVRLGGRARVLFLRLGLLAAIGGEVGQLVSMFVLKVPRFGGLIVGGFLIWVALRVCKLAVAIERSERNPAVAPQ